MFSNLSKIISLIRISGDIAYPSILWYLFLRFWWCYGHQFAID